MTFVEWGIEELIMQHLSALTQAQNNFFRAILLYHLKFSESLTDICL
jgi:hypothetical protein